MKVTLGKVVFKIQPQNIIYVIFPTGRFQFQQLVAPIKKGARFFKQVPIILFELYQIIGLGFSKH